MSEEKAWASAYLSLSFFRSRLSLNSSVGMVDGSVPSVHHVIRLRPGKQDTFNSVMVESLYRVIRESTSDHPLS